ncbi:hypothetical protein [Paenibacillus sp. FSL L8-0499]|uniref:hypothetical protein n=1 Tax=Paenibacillus sp. FSL L8-0499 TaxID=2975334 RepID=UPI0030F94588
MTPERIAEVRKILSGMNERSQLFPITVGDLNSLLAALEEAQQAIAALHEYNHRYAKERDEAKKQLVEAQQTIARQREALEKIKAAEPNPFYHIAKYALEEGEKQP